jgi:uncharacterized protein with ATP-grasp and redox domains
MTNSDEKLKLKNIVLSQRNRVIQMVNSEIKQLNELETASDKFIKEIKKHSNDFELNKTVNKNSREVKVVVGGENILVDVIEENYNTCQIVYVGKLPEGTKANYISIKVNEHITYSRSGWRPNRQGIKLCLNLGEKDIYLKCVKTFVKKVNEHVERLWDSYKYSLQVMDNKKMVVEIAKEKFSQNSVVTMMSSNVLCVTYANGTRVEMYYNVNDTTKEVTFTIKSTKIETPKNQDDLVKLLDTLGKL